MVLLRNTDTSMNSLHQHQPIDINTYANIYVVQDLAHEAVACPVCDFLPSEFRAPRPAHGPGRVVQLEHVSETRQTLLIRQRRDTCEYTHTLIITLGCLFALLLISWSQCDSYLRNNDYHIYSYFNECVQSVFKCMSDPGKFWLARLLSLYINDFWIRSFGRSSVF